MKIILFEDIGYKDLLPIVYFRPVWELRCGIYTLEEKIERFYQDYELEYIARQYLMDYYLPQEKLCNFSRKENCLFINGRLLFGKNDRKRMDSLPDNTAYLHQGEIIAFRLNQESVSTYFSAGLLNAERVLSDFKIFEDSFTLVKYPWDAIFENSEQIVQDFIVGDFAGNLIGKVNDGCHILGKENIFLAANSQVMPGSVLDAENGPIWIGENTKIMSNAVLEGPLAIGSNCIVKIGAKLYENTTIGPVCKVGGEIEESIIQGYSNKQHDGFLGHSYLGAWINIGAGTNNSDLKNNYSEISIYLNNRTVNTGRRFVGLIMGDHTKTAINTMINTGTIVGVSCNIFGRGFPPKFVPSFSWGGADSLREYNFEKATEVAKVVMERRNITFSKNDYKLFKSVKDLVSQIENRVRVS